MKSFGLSLCLALGAAGCGAHDHSDGRTYGGNNIAVTPKDVDSGDATAKAAHADGAGAKVAPAAAAAGGTAASATAIMAGVRNFQMVNRTMAALTGVASTTPAIVTAFGDLSGSLPTNTDVTAFVGSNQVAVFKLAVEYCNAMVNDPVALKAAFPAIDVTQPAATVFSATGGPAVVDAVLTKFWGSNLASLPPHDQSVQSLVAMVTDLMTGKAVTTAGPTPALLTAVCSAALSAAPVTLY